MAKQLSEQRSYILKIFSGPHMGAEILLTEGEYLIGSADECDVILSDALIAPRHLKIMVGNGDLRLTGFDEAYAVDGKMQDAAALKLNAHQIVTVGATHFGIGPENEPWAPMTLPGLPTPIGALTEGDTGSTRSPAESPAQSIDKPDDGSGEAAEVKEEKGGFAWVHAHCRGIMNAALFLWIMLTITGIWLFTLARRPMTEMPMPQTPKTIVAALHRAGFPNLDVTPMEEGKLRVSGYVDQPLQRMQILKILDSIHTVSVIPEIWVNRLILDSCRDVFAVMEMKPECAFDGRGTLTVKGFGKDIRRIEEAIDIIRRDISGVREVCNRMLTEADIFPGIRDLLTQQGAELKLDVAVHPGYITIEGRIEPEQAAVWHGIRDAIINKYDLRNYLQDHVEVKAVDKTVDLEAETVAEALSRPLPKVPVIAAIRNGDAKAVYLRDGQKFMEGEELPNGYTIKEIQVDTVILTFQGTAITYRLGSTEGEKE